MNEVGLGTELKLNLNIEPIGGISMDDYNFTAEVFCKSKNTAIINKSDAIRVDSDNYILLVDTNTIGVGSIKCKITAEIPDNDFADGLRTEVAFIETGITIVKNA